MDRYVAFLRGMNLGGRRIKNEELRRHFEEIGFEQVSSTGAPGAGLGLTISRWIVEEHGGTLTAASVLGHGSTFTVLLPVGGPASTDASPAQPAVTVPAG